MAWSYRQVNLPERRTALYRPLHGCKRKPARAYTGGGVSSRSEDSAGFNVTMPACVLSLGFFPTVFAIRFLFQESWFEKV